MRIKLKELMLILFPQSYIPRGKNGEDLDFDSSASVNYEVPSLNGGIKFSLPWNSWLEVWGLL